MGATVGLAGATSTFCDNADDPIVTREDSGTRMSAALLAESSKLRPPMGETMAEPVAAAAVELSGWRVGSELLIDAEALLRKGVMTVARGLDSLLVAGAELIRLCGLISVLSRLAAEVILERGAIST